MFYHFTGKEIPYYVYQTVCIGFSFTTRKRIEIKIYTVEYLFKIFLHNLQITIENHMNICTIYIYNGKEIELEIKKTGITKSHYYIHI